MNKPTRKSSRIKSSSNVIPKESPVDSCPNSKGASKEPELNIVVSSKRRKTKEPSEGPLLNTSNSVDNNKSNNKREVVQPEEGSRRSTRRRDAESLGNKHKLLVDSCLNGTAIKRFDYETLVEMFDKRIKPSKNASCRSKQIITVEVDDKTFEMSKRDFYKVGIDESIIRSDTEESDEKNEKINGDILSSNENGDESSKEVIEKDSEKDNFREEEKESVNELTFSNSEVTKSEDDINNKPVKLEESIPSTSNDISLNTSEAVSNSVPTTSVTDEETIVPSQVIKASPSVDCSSNTLTLPENDNTNLETDIDVDNQVSESQNETDMSKIKQNNLPVSNNDVCSSEVMDADVSSLSDSPSTNDSGSVKETANEIIASIKEELMTVENEKESTPMEVDDIIDTAVSSKVATPVKSSPASNVSTPSKPISSGKLVLNTPTKMLSPQNLKSPNKLVSPMKVQLTQSPKVISGVTSNIETIESPKAVELPPQEDGHINGEIKSAVGPTEALKIIITDSTGSGTSTAPNSSIPSDTPLMVPSSNSNVEVVKSESSIYKRVKQLKEQGLWSQARLPQVEEPKPQVIHWDFLLEEMAWMWSDFVRERKMKKQNRKNISRAIKKLQSKIEGKDEEDEKAQRIRAEKMANRVAKEIRKFWEGAAKLVTMKEEIILKKKRQEIRRKNMDKIVDQANIFSNQVGQTLQGGSVEPDEYIMDEDSNYNTLFSNDVNETDELNELDALVKSQNAPLSDILKELPPEYLAEVQGMSTSFNYNHNDTSISEMIPAKKRKIEELPEDELTLSSSGDQIDEDNSNMVVTSESSKAKITNFEKMREECQTLQPQGFTLESAHINVEQPSMIRGVLREYQLLGLNWLYTLFKRHVNGILADEMGLGKTLQTISLLAYLVEKERIWRPHLIIVPTSVILNWDMEFKKWCPNFKTLVYHGTAKERGDLRKGWTKDDSFDVVITSYKIIINDINVFRKRKWQYLILDEAHTIKNFKSQAWQKLVNLKSMNRLLLTGTPLQNDLMELHSLLKFLMPTIFTSQSDFKEVFNDPLVDFAGGSGDSNPELVGKLHDILRPFLLRRLKKDVEKQLPKKREIVVRCSLANRQRSLYDDFICRRETQALLASGSIFHVLNVTMQLRKVCNHPNLHETRSVESPVVLFTIRVPYPAIVFDIAQPVIDQKLRNLPTCLIFNGNRSYSIRALSCLRKIKCTRQEYASNSSAHTHAIPKLKGFKLNFHNFISTKMYNRENLENGQRLFDVDMDNIEMLHMKVGDEFVLSFDDDEIDRIPLVLKDKKPLLCKFEIDPATKKPGMYVVNCNHVVFPTKLQELQFSRNTRNDFILIKRGEAEARKLRFHGIDHKNFSSFVQLPKNYSTKALLNFRAVSTHYNNKKTIQGGSNNQSNIKKEPVQVDNDVVMENVEENEEKDFKTPEYFTYLRTLNPEDFVDKRAREQQLQEKENCADMISSLSVERISNIRDPIIYDETICLLKREFSENLELRDHSVLFNWLDYDKSVDMYNKRFLEDLLDGCVDKFDIYTYPAISRGVQLIPVGKGRNYDIINEMENSEKMSKEVYDNLDIYYHKLETSAMFSFPELRLIEYDCGKLQRLTIMLRELFTQGHRVLIFTQMSSMLDILQEFLSYHGYKYFRLDGSTPLDQRQAMMEQFNNDNKIFCFILSTRSGGIGINLTGADTVIFYDSDWNPTMDAQAQDRCHRIGQTKDVTIYRLISEYTIEEAILERATMKRKLGEMAIDNAKFTPDYFRNMNIKDLFRDNIQSFDKEIIESKVEVASDTEIRKALALTEDKIDANAAELAEKEAATEYDEILPNPQGYDDQEINEELKPYVETLTDVEKYAVKYLQQLNDPELQKRLEEIEINDQLDVIENTNEHKESTEGFDEILLIPHTCFDVPTYAPLSPPLTQYDSELTYYDKSQYFLYRSDLMTEAELPSHIYEWPKRKQNNKLGVINVDTNQTNAINEYLRTNERYSPSASAVISMESSPKDCPDTAAPSPIPMETEERIRRTVIGGETYNCPRIPPTCCDPILFGELRAAIDYNVFNKPWLGYNERGFPYNAKSDYEQINWNVVEDYFLFKAVAIDQNIRSVDFASSRCRELPNWLYVESVVNKYSKVYRPARQCHLRYLHSIVPKEEGRDQVYDLIGRKLRKVQISQAEHSFRKRHGKKRLEEFYLHDAKKILKLSIAAEAKVIVSQPLKKSTFSLVPKTNVDYTEFSDGMKKSLNERLSIPPENRFSIKNFSDPNYKLKNWIKNDTSQPTKPSHIDNAIASMNQRVKDYHDRSTPFKKTALCVGNNNSFLDPVDCTTIERVDFSDSSVFRQQAPIVRSDYSNIGPTRTIQIARRPVNISGSQMNVGQTPQLMPMTYRSGGLTINNTGQGNTTRYIQAGDISHQRRFSVQSNRTSNLSQSSSTSSGTTTIQQYHSQGPQKQQPTQSPISVPQSQQQTSTQQQYHPPVVVNSGDRGIPRIASFQYVQSKNHPTPQNVTRPPVRTMYPAGTGRKIHQMPTNRIQGSGNYIYSVQSGHPNIVKTVSTHRYITKPPSSQQQPQSQQSQQTQQQQPQQQSQPAPHQQPPQRVPQASGPSYILKEKLSL